jgi:hypothetical protein
MRRSLRLATFAAVGALVLAACGDGDDEGDVVDDIEAAPEDALWIRGCPDVHSAVCDADGGSRTLG